MTKKRMRCLVTIWVLCFIAAVAAACADQNKADFVAAFTDRFDEKIYAGTTIDVEDYIVLVDGAEYTVEIEFDGVRETVTGRTYVLAQPGQYKMHYTVTKNGASATGTKDFAVYDTLPTVYVPNATQIYKKDADMLLDAILGRLSPSVVSDSSYSMRIIQADIFDLPAVSLKPSNETEAEPIETIRLDDDTRFTFSRTGLYKFTFEVTNAGGTVTASFNAAVLEDIPLTALENVEAYRNAEFAKEGDTFDSSVVKLTGAGNYANASYVALNNYCEPGSIISVDFYGKNVPYISLQSVNPVNGEIIDYGMLSGNGLIFSLERMTDRYSLYGTNKYGTASARIKYGSASPDRENEMFGWDKLEDDVHYGLEVAIIPDESSFVEAGDGVDGYTKGTLYFYLYEIDDETGDMELVAYIDSTYGGFDLKDKFPAYPQYGNTIFYSSPSKDVTFRYNLDRLTGSDWDTSQIFFNKDTKTVTWNPVDYAKYYHVTVGTRKLTLPANTLEISVAEEFASLGEFDSFSVQVRPSIGYNELHDKVYSISIENNPEGYEDIVLSGGVIDTVTDTVTLQGTAAIGEKEATRRNLASMSASRSFLAFKGEYGVGYYTEFTFKGKNMPQLAFFKENVSGNMADGGILLLNALWGTDADGVTPINDGVFSSTQSVWGPTGLTTGLGETTDRMYFDKKDTTLGMDSLDDNKYYRYVVGFFEAEGGYLGLEVGLYVSETEGGAETAVKEMTLVFDGTSPALKTIMAEDMPAGNIVCYSAVRAEDTVFTFVQRPYVPKEAPYEIFGGSVDEATGVITLQGTAAIGEKEATRRNLASMSASRSFLAFKGEYGVGYYTEFTFKGKNMPQLAFFKENVSGNMADGGILLLNALWGTDADGVTPINDGVFSSTQSVWGPTGLTTGLGETTDRMYFDKKDTTLGMDSLDDNKYYRYVVGFFEAEGGYLGLEVGLYVSETEGGAETAVKEMTLVFDGTSPALKTIMAEDMPAGNIVCYSAVRAEETVFRVLHGPYMPQNENGVVV